MLGELGLGTTRLAANRTSECSQAGIQFYVSYTVLFQGIRPLECITTVIIEVRTLVVHIVHVPNVVFLATCLVRTLTNKTVIALASRCAKQKILHSLKKNCHVCL